MYRRVIKWCVMKLLYRKNYLLFTRITRRNRQKYIKVNDATNQISTSCQCNLTLVYRCKKWKINVHDSIWKRKTIFTLLLTFVYFLCAIERLFRWKGFLIFFIVGFTPLLLYIRTSVRNLFTRERENTFNKANFYIKKNIFNKFSVW